MDNTPALVVEEKQQQHLILIIDKENRFGNALAERVYQDATVVLVSQESPSDPTHIVHVPFSQAIPQIPDGSYSHIFFVWEGKSDTLELVRPLVEKAYAEGSRFLFITDYHFFDESLTEKIFQPGVIASIVLTGDIYDDPRAEGRIPELFAGIRRTTAITLPEMGLEPLYLVNREDTLTALLHAGFGMQKGKTFFAFPKDPHTLLTLAHGLQKTEPLLRIDFVKSDSPHHFAHLPKGEAVVAEKGQLKSVEEAFSLYLKTAPKEEKPRLKKEEPRVETFIPKPVAPVRKKGQFPLWQGLVLLVCLLLLPTVLTAGTAGLGSLLLTQTKQAAIRGNFSLAATLAQGAANLFELTEQVEQPINVFLTTIGQKALADTIIVNTANAATLSQAAVSTANAFASFQKAQTSPLSESMFHDGTNSLKNAILLAQRVNSEDSHAWYKKELATLKQGSILLGDTVDVLPQLLGSSKKQTYLVLFQNNMELRPSGGFIGSYGVVTVEKGIVKDFKIQNVYDADGQLKGHVEPPFAIRRYIPLVHWYLRDSGFDVDFAKSAANAAFFLKQETDQQVDGVIGIDLSLVKGLLQATGPIYVPEYKERVSAENFFLVTENHSEKNSFAGSTQKQDFLASFYKALEEKLMSKQVSPAALLQTVLAAVAQKHILITVADPSVQNIFTVNGLSSSLWDGRKAADNTLLDFIGINEANIGVNKVNYFVNRAVEQDMTISPTGTISGKLTITFTNRSDGSWPGGDYKNYLRFILPGNAILRKLQINGEDKQLTAAITDPAVYEAKNFKLPIGLEIEKTAEEGKALYGFLVTVPAKHTTTIVALYDFTQKVDVSQPTLTYSQKVFKQPGVDSYPFVFTLSYPQSVKPLQMPTGWEEKNGVLFYKTELTTDLQNDVTLSQQ